ncbi:hypothetical protein D3C78_1302010 [compost metagenome]
MQALAAVKHGPGLFEFALVHVQPGQGVAASGIGEIVGIIGDGQQLGEDLQQSCGIVLAQCQAGLQHREHMLLLAVERSITTAQLYQALLHSGEIARV